MMRSAWVVLAFVLAGCSGAPAETEEENNDYDDFQLDGTPDALGVIRGVVVDVAFQPLAGATVWLAGHSGPNVTTTANGAFAFRDLEPGAYFVQVVKQGYKETQTSTDVKAGVRDPPVVRVRLERIPGSEPLIVDDLFQGYITCSIRVPAAGFNDGCVAFGNLGLGSTQRKDIGFEPGNIWWLQVEQVWEPNLDTAERLCADAGPNIFGSSICGPSPILRSYNRTHVQQRDFDEGQTIPYVVYPDHLLMGVSGNLVVEQDFEVFSHAFYNFLPPADWQFSRDGLPPTPV